MMQAERIQTRYEKAEAFVAEKTYERYFLSVSKLYKLCVFGAGALGHTVIQWLQKSGIHISFVSDNKFPIGGGGYSILGVPGISPTELEQIKDEVYVIVAVANKEALHNKVINEQLLDFPHIMRNPLGLSAYWAQTFDLPQGADVAELLKNAENCFEDAYSRDIYIRLWELRMQDQVIDYAQDMLCDVYSPTQYIVKDLVDYQKIHTYIDCGAFIGDSLTDFINLGTNAEYFCFEMDREIFRKLEETVNMTYAEKKSKIHLYNYGVSNNRATVRYKSIATGGSSIDESGDQVAELILLDDISFNQKADLIKMDIEGAEEAALEGARELISRDHPVLAISLYHNFSQFLNVPVMIKKINPRYKCYLRHHKYTLDDTVCYAVYQ